MHFLSSKVVHQLETAFSCILTSQRVKQGEIRLEKLKRQDNYELALATFISRSSNYHQRLLAVLQLEKQLKISDPQTAWSLKDVYYRDSDKIAQKICKLITAQPNLQLAREFLTFDENQSGLCIYRQIEIVFSLLKHEMKVKSVLQLHYSLLYEYFLKVAKVLQCQEEGFYFTMVCLALFYYGNAKNNGFQISQQLQQHWNQIKDKCLSCQLQQISILTNIINKIIFKSPFNQRQNVFRSFLKATFQSISKNDTLRLNYRSTCLKLLILNDEILSQPMLRQELIQGIKYYNFNKISSTLINFKIYGEIQIEFDNDLELQNNNELLVRQSCNMLIETLFAHHYDWIKYQYLPKYTTSIEALESLLSLINYYNSSKLIPNNEASLLTDKVFNILNEQTIIAGQNIDQAFIIQTVTLIEFLTKFKSSIEISLLPKVVSTLVQKRSIQVFSPFCDAFLSVIWKQLTFMQTNQLVDFTECQLQLINGNLWTATFKSYQWLLHIAQYLEESYQYFTTCNQTDSLLHHFLNSHQIICQIIGQNSKVKLNLELFQMLLQMTACIISNKNLKMVPSVINLLNLPLLVEKIDKYLLLSEVSATIIAFNHHKSQTLIEQLNKERQNWAIDELDYSYRIQLYLKYIEFASEMLSPNEIASLRRSLGAKIIDFIKSLPQGQLYKFKQSKLWDHLQHIYNISSFISFKMEIQQS